MDGRERAEVQRLLGWLRTQDGPVVLETEQVVRMHETILAAESAGVVRVYRGHQLLTPPEDGAGGGLHTGPRWTLELQPLPVAPR